MWFNTNKMGSFQFFLVSRPSSGLYKCLIAGLGFILVVTVGSFSLGCIFFTSIIVIVSTVFFTLFFSQNPKQFIRNHEEKRGCSEVRVACTCLEEQVTESLVRGVFQIQEGSGSMNRALNFLAKVSEEESTGDDDDENDDDHRITTSEDDDDDKYNNYVARCSLSSKDDGSISDEDKLIEIELPTGHYLSPKKYSKQKQSWMEELLSEANNEPATEEDNLIEIDISAGSIMCPRFEIEA